MTTPSHTLSPGHRATSTPAPDVHADADAAWALAPAMPAPRPRRVLFLGTHGQFNIGDELLLRTFLDQLGHQHAYTVNSYAPSETAAALGDVDASVFDTAGPRTELLRRIRRADVVVFGGGSIVKELYASVGRWRHATLVMVLAIVVAARMLRTPVLLSNIGVGPLHHRGGRLLAGAILRTATLVTVRDEGSLATCRSLGCDPDRVRLVPDAVWANDPSDLRPADADAARHDPAPPAEPARRLRLALNLNRDIEVGAEWPAFLDRLEVGLRRVAAERPIEVHGLPMQSRFKADTDLDVLDGFLARFDDDSRVDVVRHVPVDHHDVAAIVTACDVVVAERLHAIVVSAILGRAVVGLPYDVKVRELVDQLELTDRSVDVNRSFDPDDLAAMVLATAGDPEAEGRRLARLATRRRHEALDAFAEVRAWLDHPDPGRRQSPLKATTWTP